MLAVAGEQGERTRARYPDASGRTERDGVHLAWELFGDGEPTLLLLPTWSIVHSRCWKMQIPYFARRARVLTFDGRGNGRSDRPCGAQAYSVEQFAADTVAVMDATDTDSAVLVALSCGALWATVVAAEHPARVSAIVYIAPSVGLAPGYPEREQHPFEEPLESDQGWAKYNAHYWRRDYAGFAEFFFAQNCHEPHSSKQIEDCVGWALETTPDTLIDTTRGIGVPGREPFRQRCARVACPTLVMHGDEDRVRPHAQGAALARATNGSLVTLKGAGHMPQARDPVLVNQLLAGFATRAEGRASWTRAPARSKRALYISSPIGLGHVRRDLAIADELRRLEPALEIDWLAQHPVTAVLQERGERIHPASAELASESRHMQLESRQHELHCFQALRRMDEILLANFMVFLDVAQQERYDLWIGDEAWDVDYYLHENPELKSAAYAWLTDFVGYLPVDLTDERECMLTADYNAEMIEQIERYPRVRDRAVFIGERDDIVPERFGDGLPAIRDWTEQHFCFTGYVTGFERSDDRTALRERLGYAAGEQVCVVSVGGSGVGEALLARVIESLPLARAQVPGLRMIAVAGPRIDAATLPAPEGLDLRGYVPDLPSHLAACDLAIVQGGLASTMELTAHGRPFLYFPLAKHFEQTIHVRHRLERYRAGECMDFEQSPPPVIADAIARMIGADVDYRPVEPGGAARAAGLIAELL